MWDKITGTVGAILKPITSLIDDVHTSDEERAKLAAARDQISASVTTKILEVETRALEAVTKVQMAELGQDDKITKRWRPYVGYLLGTAIGINLLAPPIAALLGRSADIPQAEPELVWIAASLLGVKAVGRSIEKRARTLLGKAGGD